MDAQSKIADTDSAEVEDIRARLRAAQAHVGRRRTSPLPGGEDQPGGGLIRAAVLAPLVLRPEGVTVLLTRRTDHLSVHAGQVSFPGGRIEPDEDALSTALRETEEEIGLARDHVEIIGRLDSTTVRARFDVTPYVGLVAPPFSLTPNVHEVAAIFEVPLAFVRDKSNFEVRARNAVAAAPATSGSGNTHFWAFEYGGHLVWGATASILVNLSEVLRG